MPPGYVYTKKLVFTDGTAGFYGRKAGASGKSKMDLLWMLRKKVAIPPRPYLTPAAQTAKPKFEKAILDAMRFAFRNG